MLTKQRPIPPTAQGLVDGTIVQTAWYEYLNADRQWALDEIERLSAEVENSRTAYEVCCIERDALRSAHEPEKQR